MPRYDANALPKNALVRALADSIGIVFALYIICHVRLFPLFKNNEPTKINKQNVHNNNTEDGTPYSPRI